MLGLTEKAFYERFPSTYKRPRPYNVSLSELAAGQRGGVRGHERWSPAASAAHAPAARQDLASVSVSSPASFVARAVASSRPAVGGGADQASLSLSASSSASASSAMTNTTPASPSPSRARGPRAGTTVKLSRRLRRGEL